MLPSVVQSTCDQRRRDRSGREQDEFRNERRVVQEGAEVRAEQQRSRRSTLIARPIQATRKERIGRLRSGTCGATPITRRSNVITIPDHERHADRMQREYDRISEIGLGHPQDQGCVRKRLEYLQSASRAAAYTVCAGEGRRGVSPHFSQGVLARR